MLNSAFERFTDVRSDYYPAELRVEIDRINDVIYPNVNNGVTAQASPPRRPPMKKPCGHCLQRLINLKSGYRASATSSIAGSP